MSLTLLIRAKPGIVFRAMADLLNDVVREFPLFATQQGLIVQVCKKDPVHPIDVVMVEVLLRREELDTYRLPTLAEGQVICMGLDAKIFKDLTCAIKKKQDVEVFCYKEMPNDLCIRVSDSVAGPNSRQAEKTMRLKEVSEDSVTSPEYDNARPNAVVKAGDYKSAIAEFKRIQKKGMVLVQAQQEAICLTMKQESSVKCVAKWGEWDDASPTTYEGLFPLTRIALPVKLAMVAARLKFYASPNLPIKIAAEVCDALGTINIYIQPDPMDG